MALDHIKEANTGDTLTAAQKLAYGSGNFASLTTGYGISSLANYVFNIALGVNPALASGPFITTANDIIGLAVYFGVAHLLYREERSSHGSRMHRTTGQRSAR